MNATRVGAIGMIGAWLIYGVARGGTFPENREGNRESTFFGPFSTIPSANL
jgi:hypothetical protein